MSQVQADTRTFELSKQQQASAVSETPPPLPSPTEVIPTDKVEVGFKDIDAAILVGSMPRKEGMERKDLLKANVAIFKTQGAALDKFAKKTVKVTSAPLLTHSRRPSGECGAPHTPGPSHTRASLARFWWLETQQTPTV